MEGFTFPAAEWKEKGTDAFKECKWEDARNCYNKALDAIADAESARAALAAAGSTSKDDTANIDLQTSCHLNICACSLKTQDWEEVTYHASRLGCPGTRLRHEPHSFESLIIAVHFTPPPPPPPHFFPPSS
jgi:hypothetical protein